MRDRNQPTGGVTVDQPLNAREKRSIQEDRGAAICAHVLRRRPGVTGPRTAHATDLSDVLRNGHVFCSQGHFDYEHAAEYADLAEEIREEDRIFATTSRHAADQLGQRQSRPVFAEVLFPSGPPAGEREIRQALELYKIMVDSSEKLVSRRQGVNTFFLTINGALLTASGLIVQSSGGNRLGGLGIAVVGMTGALLCAAWRSLITSFGQLNRGKFQVINTIERYFKAAIYAAEWEAMGRGENPNVYRSFTSREIWVPNVLIGVHVLTAITALLVAVGWLSLNPG